MSNDYCSEHRCKRKRRTGTSSRGPWVGWFCQNKECKPIFEDDAPKNETKTEPAPAHSVQVDQRELSIAAQACCKAACEAAAGIYYHEASNEATYYTTRAWIVQLAQELLSQVVLPTMRGTPMPKQIVNGGEARMVGYDERNPPPIQDADIPF